MRGGALRLGHCPALADGHLLLHQEVSLHLTDKQRGSVNDQFIDSTFVYHCIRCILRKLIFSLLSQCRPYRGHQPEGGVHGHSHTKERHREWLRPERSELLDRGSSLSDHSLRLSPAILDE